MCSSALLVKRVTRPHLVHLPAFAVLGYEVSGVIDELCNTVAVTSGFENGDRVIVYPANQEITNTGY